MKMKRTLLILVTIVVGTLAAYAQTPDAFNYQAAIRDSEGEPLTNQSVGIKLNILEGSPAGAVVFSETHTTTTNEYGLVNVKIGMGTNVQGSIDGIAWSSNEYYLEVQIDKDGGTDYQIMGTSQFVSVPYALRAKALDNSPGLGDILEADNSAGSYNLDMNDQDVYNVDSMTGRKILLDNLVANEDSKIRSGSNIRYHDQSNEYRGRHFADDFGINTYTEDIVYWGETDVNLYASIGENGMTIISDDGPGDLTVDGDLDVYGNKNFVQQHPTKSSKEIVYTAVEGPEAATYVRDTAQLVNGKATIEFPEHYKLVTDKKGLTAQVTPAGNCNGLFVKELTNGKLVVKELNNGNSNVEFYYLVHGIRKGHEDKQVIREKQQRQLKAE
ncbi:MAG: hypothetical protein K9I94_13270 [Bacteroidales bacterium]|nr:hypothetical protein [Bacteroidales bacterium]